MADVSITPGVVTTTGTINTEVVTAGAAITQGDVVYRDSNGRAQKAEASSADASDAIGIALNDVDGTGQPLTVLTGGTLDIVTSGFTVGETYAVSANAAKIAPVSDLGIGEFVCVLGIATSARLLPLNIRRTRTAKD